MSERASDREGGREREKGRERLGARESKIGRNRYIYIYILEGIVSAKKSAQEFAGVC